MIDTKKLRELHAKLVAGEQALPWHIEHCGAKDCWCRMVIGKGVYKVPNSSLTCDYVIPSGAVGESQAEVIVFFANEMPKLLDELDRLRGEPTVSVADDVAKSKAALDAIIDKAKKMKTQRRKNREKLNRALARSIKKTSRR